MVKSGHIRMENAVFLILSLIVATVRSARNLALFKTATQSSNHRPDKWLASAAVDGCHDQQTASNALSGCCSHTLAPGAKTAWWRVDLGQISTVNRIQIIYRADFKRRFAGYQLYVSNTTISPQDGVLCYEDTSSTEAAVQLNVTHQCPYVGSYVTVYNYRNNPKRHSWYDDYAILELCEVLVYGCAVGMYGDGDCTQVCPATCYGGNCNPKTGSCLYCVGGKYGVTCDMDCSGNCKDPICDRNTGYCPECVTGTYGSSCGQACSIHCADRVCTKTNGNCIECTIGKYGASCDQDCPVNCRGGCTRDNARCVECVANKFGTACDQNCPTNCQNGLCNKDTGYCVDCVAGTYGSSCGQACSVNCKKRVCTKTTGHCIECVTGKYGSRCDQDCSVHCKDGLCAKDTGNCSECTIGKYGASCDQDCPVNCRDGCTRDNARCVGCKTGRYGTTCTSICPVTCKDFMCDQQTGQCLDCLPGKYGAVCSSDCPGSCNDNICKKEDGRCLTQGVSNVEESSVDSSVIIIAVQAVVCGLLAAALIATIICICWLRHKDKEKKSPNKTTDQSGLDTGYTTIDRGDVEPPNVYEMVVMQ